MKKTVKLIAAMMLVLMLSGFTMETTIHEDGSQTHDIIKESSKSSVKKQLDSEEKMLQERGYIVTNYSDKDTEGIQAIHTINNETAQKMSVDKIVHRIYSGFFEDVYYSDYVYKGNDSFKQLLVGDKLSDNDVDIDYSITFPVGSKVSSNSKDINEKSDTYRWKLTSDQPTPVLFFAMAWHRQTIIFTLFAMGLMLFAAFFISRRRRNMYNRKAATRLKFIQLLCVFLPVALLGFMGYEYYASTHMSQNIIKAAQKQQDAMEASMVEKQKATDAKQEAAIKTLSTISGIEEKLNSELRTLENRYQNGKYDKNEVQTGVNRISSQAGEVIDQIDALTDAPSAERSALRDTLSRIRDKATAIGRALESAKTEPITKSSSKDKVADTTATTTADGTADGTTDAKAKKETAPKPDAVDTKDTTKKTIVSK